MKAITIFYTLFFMLNTVNAQQYRSVDEANGLEVGHKAPRFNAIDADNNLYSLEKSLETGPVVVIFYRGYWCPVCNKHLSQIQDSLELIYEKGATVVAVSPQKPEFLDKMREKAGTEFTLVYDEGYQISDDYDVTFLPETKKLFSYNTFLGANLKETQSDNSQRLPIPATFIVNQDGIIVWRQFNPDYKKRSSVLEIVNGLSKISEYEANKPGS